jgi:hypothetical protein
LLTATNTYQYCQSNDVQVFWDDPYDSTVDGKSASVMAWTAMAMTGYEPFTAVPALQFTMITPVNKTNIFIQYLRNDPRLTNIVIQASTNLINWAPVQTNRLPARTNIWIDTNTFKLQPHKYYRIQSQTPLSSNTGLPYIPVGAVSILGVTRTSNRRKWKGMLAVAAAVLLPFSAAASVNTVNITIPITTVNNFLNIMLGAVVIAIIYLWNKNYRMARSQQLREKRSAESSRYLDIILRSFQ